MIRLNMFERETIILFNEADDTARIDAYNTAMKRRLETLRHERPEEISLVRSDEYSDRYIVPKKWIRIVPPHTPTEKRLKQLAQARANITK